MEFDESTVSRAINDVTNALLANKYRLIKWPNQEEILKFKQNFFSRGGFPGVISCIDGIHVRIQAPSEDEAVFVNGRGGMPSMYRSFVIMKVLTSLHMVSHYKLILSNRLFFNSGSFRTK